jgi:hypothetical protein
MRHIQLANALIHLAAERCLTRTIRVSRRDAEMINRSARGLAGANSSSLLRPPADSIGHRLGG